MGSQAGQSLKEWFEYSVLKSSEVSPFDGALQFILALITGVVCL